MAISVTVKRRKKIDPSQIIYDLYRVTDHVAGEAEELYAQSTETWKREPYFTSNVHREEDLYRVNIYARGDMVGIYKGIDEGFNRQVAVTEDWVSKTQPGVLRAREGRGHLLRGPNGKPVLLQTPEPVIPRNFTKMIADMLAPQFFSQMNQVWKKHFEVSNG